MLKESGLKAPCPLSSHPNKSCVLYFAVFPLWITSLNDTLLKFPICRETDSVTLIRDSERKIIFHSWVIRINSTCAAAHIDKPQLDSELIKVEPRVETFVFTKLTIISDSVFSGERINRGMVEASHKIYMLLF